MGRGAEGRRGLGRQVGQRVPCLQPWMSDAEEPFLDPALRKRAVKVKHVKRREKKSEKKVMERANGGKGRGRCREGVGPSPRPARSGEAAEA